MYVRMYLCIHVCICMRISRISVCPRDSVFAYNWIWNSYTTNDAKFVYILFILCWHFYAYLIALKYTKMKLDMDMHMYTYICMCVCVWKLSSAFEVRESAPAATVAVNCWPVQALDYNLYVILICNGKCSTCIHTSIYICN